MPRRSWNPKGRDRVLRFGCGVAATVAAVLALHASDAAAQCTIGTCDATYCDINCPTGGDYLVFGSLWAQLSPGGLYGWAGIGVCRFAIDGSYNKGAYRDRRGTTQQTADYRIYADPSSGTGNDVVRLARPDPGSSYETCLAASPTVKGVMIYPGLPDSTDSYYFVGGSGNDRLYLCSCENPTSGNCLPSTNHGRGAGSYDNDILWGSVNADELWGGGGTDTLWGYGEADILHGGPNAAGAGNEDWLYGGLGPDTLYGDTGDDYLLGQDDCDTLNGGDGYDRCLCGETGEVGQGYYPTSCEGYVDPWVTFNCPGCLTFTGDGVDVECPSALPEDPAPDGWVEPSSE